MKLQRAIFPPPRVFLSLAAGVAAGSAALAPAVVATAPANAAPGAVPDAPKASPEFAEQHLLLLLLMAAVAAIYDKTRLHCRESAVIGYQVTLSYVWIHGVAPIGGAA